MEFELEICANSIMSALAAEQGGANRIELCDNLAEGGTTPSAGMVRACKELLSIPVFPIIRPRGGDFLYSDEEFEVMKQDVTFCKESGCEGVVLGILRADGSVDTERCAQLIALARPMQVTFHRAFDRCNDLQAELEAVISLGCERLLTSGGELKAEDGVASLSSLVELSAGRINIMPGAGINSDNILQIAQSTGARAFHGTAKTIVPSLMQHYGKGRLVKEDGKFPILQTDILEVRKMRKALDDYSLTRLPSSGSIF